MLVPPGVVAVMSTVPGDAVGTHTVSCVGVSTVKHGFTVGFAGLLQTVLTPVVPTCTLCTLYAAMPKVPEKVDPATVTLVLTEKRPLVGEMVVGPMTGGAGAVWLSFTEGHDPFTAGFATGLLMWVPRKKFDAE